MRTLILAGLGAGICLAGCTTAPDTVVEMPSAAVDLTCAPRTASRIERPDGDCAGAPGRSYSQDQLRRTGGRSTAEALELLDPSIRISR